MKNYIRTAALLLCTIAYSNADIIIKQRPCPTKPESMCWTIIIGKKPLPEKTIAVNSGKIEGDKLMLTVRDTKAIPEAELARMVKEGVHYPKNFFSADVLKELGVKGLDGKIVTPTSDKGQVVVAARDGIKFPPITIGITINIKLGK